MTIIIKLDSGGTQARVLPFPPQEYVAPTAPVLDPGESYLGIPYDGWVAHLRDTVDIPQLRLQHGIYPSHPDLPPKQRVEAALRELPNTIQCPFCPGQMESGAARLAEDRVAWIFLGVSYMKLVHTPADGGGKETLLSPRDRAVSWRCSRCDTSILKRLGT